MMREYPCNDPHPSAARRRDRRPWRRYYDDVVLNNLMESLLELTAADWTHHDRTLVFERAIGELLAESHASPDVQRLIEDYRPSSEEQARRRAAREQLVALVFRSFARRRRSSPPRPARVGRAGRIRWPR